MSKVDEAFSRLERKIRDFGLDSPASALTDPKYADNLSKLQDSVFALTGFKFSAGQLDAITNLVSAVSLQTAYVVVTESATLNPFQCRATNTSDWLEVNAKSPQEAAEKYAFATGTTVAQGGVVLVKNGSSEKRFILYLDRKWNASEMGK